MGPDGFIQMGDLMNLECVSPYNKDLKRGAIVDANDNLLCGQLEEDYRVTNVFLDEVDKVTKNAKEKIILEGNHDRWMWWYRNFQINGPMQNSPWLSLPKALHLKDRGYKWIPYGNKNSSYRIGKVDVFHGDYINTYHAAKTIAARGRSCIYAHVHECQSFSMNNMNGMSRAWAIGCLRSLDAPFMKGRANSWSHAIGVLEVRKNGNFNMYTVDIINGEATYNGKTYRAKKIIGL
jgi:hypothetical protein